MYEIHIESSEFKGKRTIQQHQLVNQVNYVNPAFTPTCVSINAVNCTMLCVTHFIYTVCIKY